MIGLLRSGPPTKNAIFASNIMEQREYSGKAMFMERQRALSDQGFLPNCACQSHTSPRGLQHSFNNGNLYYLVSPKMRLKVGELFHVCDKGLRDFICSLPPE